MKSGGNVKVNACQRGVSCPQVSAKRNEKQPDKNRIPVKMELGVGYQAQPKGVKAHVGQVVVGVSGLKKNEAFFGRIRWERSRVGEKDYGDGCVVSASTINTFAVTFGIRHLFKNKWRIKPFVTYELGGGVSWIEKEGIYGQVRASLGIGLKVFITKDLNLLVELVNTGLVWQDRMERSMMVFDDVLMKQVKRTFDGGQLYYRVGSQISLQF